MFIHLSAKFTFFAKKTYRFQYQYHNVALLHNQCQNTEDSTFYYRQSVVIIIFTQPSCLAVVTPPNVFIVDFTMFTST